MFVTCLLVTGCASVPSTKFSLDPKTGVLTLDSPKNVSFNNLDATLSNGNHIILQGYSSTNAVDVIAAVAAANAQMAGKLIEALQLLESMAAKGAVASPQPAFYMQVAPVTEPSGYKPLMVPSPPKP